MGINIMQAIPLDSDEYLLTLERESNSSGIVYSEEEVLRELGITEEELENAEELEIE